MTNNLFDSRMESSYVIHLLVPEFLSREINFTTEWPLRATYSFTITFGCNRTVLKYIYRHDLQVIYELLKLYYATRLTSANVTSIALQGAKLVVFLLHEVSMIYRIAFIYY